MCKGWITQAITASRHYSRHLAAASTQLWHAQWWACSKRSWCFATTANSPTTPRPCYRAHHSSDHRCMAPKSADPWQGNRHLDCNSSTAQRRLLLHFRLQLRGHAEALTSGIPILRRHRSTTHPPYSHAYCSGPSTPTGPYRGTQQLRPSSRAPDSSTSGAWHPRASALVGLQPL
jgi:hypothetical protein